MTNYGLATLEIDGSRLATEKFIPGKVTGEWCILLIRYTQRIITEFIMDLALQRTKLISKVSSLTETFVETKFNKITNIS